MSTSVLNSKYFLIFTIIIAIVFNCTNVKIKAPDFGASVKHDSLTSIFFFDEQIQASGFSYAYPAKSTVCLVDTVSKNGLYSLKISLDPTSYSGAIICRGKSVDLSCYRDNAVLKFWIKGDNAQEIASIGIADECHQSENKTIVRLPINKYSSINTEWQQVSIPLIDFSDHGVYWNEFNMVEIPRDINWTRISEIRIEIQKNKNSSFNIFLDDIIFEPDLIDTLKHKPALTWGRRIETVIPHTSKPFDNTVISFFNGNYPSKGFPYVYGGRTACVEQKNALCNKRKILTCYFDNSEHSGISIVANSSKGIDLKELRKNNGGLVFEMKSGSKIDSIQVGLLDHSRENKKVQSRVSLCKYGGINQQWNRFVIPLRHFSDIGYYWDEKYNIECQRFIDWSNIHEIRFSCSKNSNQIEVDTPLTVYLDDIYIIKNIHDSSEMDKYWNRFQSYEPELVLHDFTTTNTGKWVSLFGSNSQISYEIVDPPAKSPENMSKCIKVDYSHADWCNLIYSYKDNQTDSSSRNWTRHWGIRFFLYTDKMFQGLTVQITDSGDEVFVANIGALQGWNDIIIPFKEFCTFVQYQPANAIINHKLDLNCIQYIDFKASGTGTSGIFYIGNIRLTNERDSKVMVSSE